MQTSIRRTIMSAALAAALASMAPVALAQTATTIEQEVVVIDSNATAPASNPSEKMAQSFAPLVGSETDSLAVVDGPQQGEVAGLSTELVKDILAAAGLAVGALQGRVGFHAGIVPCRRGPEDERHQQGDRGKVGTVQPNNGLDAVFGVHPGARLGTRVAGADLRGVQTLGAQAADQAGRHVAGTDKGNASLAHVRSL